MAIRFDRLLKLAEHLEQKKLLHDRFHFAHFHFEQGCKTLGCAIGESPAIWPRSWKIREDKYGEVYPLLNNCDDPGESACKWYGINEAELDHLFFPHGQQPGLYGGIGLSSGATKEQVAANIREFVKVMKSKQHTERKQT